NITGRYGPRHLVDPRNPKKLVGLRLTERTHGNACGIGVGDVTTRALVENIDYQKTWTNNVTASELGGGRTPIWMPDDRSAIALAIATCPRIDRAAPRLVRIESTLRLDEMWVSESLWQSDGVRNSRLAALGEPVEIDFTPQGHLRELPLPAFSHGRAPWSSQRGRRTCDRNDGSRASRRASWNAAVAGDAALPTRSGLAWQGRGALARAVGVPRRGPGSRG